ncbi:hypothetical protein HDF16_005081 [Granulicella aggregans]|uniref:Uncharacterized protein n=1 Tax=Granulicella aggregans TaxID=474949 RepID=A0A7W7ZI35_9BACT|nr:hypothetical protein [Granulicella aggregans]
MLLTFAKSSDGRCLTLRWKLHPVSETQEFAGFYIALEFYQSRKLISWKVGWNSLPPGMKKLLPASLDPPPTASASCSLPATEPYGILGRLPTRVLCLPTVNGSLADPSLRITSARNTHFSLLQISNHLLPRKTLLHPKASILSVQVRFGRSEHFNWCKIPRPINGAGEAARG